MQFDISRLNRTNIKTLISQGSPLLNLAVVQSELADWCMGSWGGRGVGPRQLIEYCG